VPVDLKQLLSPPQYEAATELQAPVCILAGAGSGKTRVITHRIAWLMTTHRVAAESIMGVTFTNKAAGEMRERVERLVPGRGGRVQLGTFHGLAARTLRRFGRVVDVDPSFVIYDADDAHRLLGKILVNDLDDKKEMAGPVSHMIDSWQSEGLSPAEVPKGHELHFDLALKAYALYVEKLKASRALDFGGLLVKFRALVTGPDHDVVTRRVRHVLADEYQDVNQVQADIVLALAKRADTCAVVGDDDQAIYGWRGASADNLKKFMITMPGARLVKLEENYRSTPAILEAANGIIEKNEARLGKVLRPAGQPDRGRLVRIQMNATDLDEARRAVNVMIEHVATGKRLDDIAVLYRTNGQSRVFEDELRRHGLPYRIVGGVRFYERKEIKDVLATLRVTLNRSSDVDALRFLQAVPRGVGATTISKLEAVARAKGVPLMVAMSRDAHLEAAGLTGATAKKVRAVVEVLDRLAAQIGRPERPDPQPGLFVASAALGAKDAVALAVQASGVADRLEAEGDFEAQGRLDNLMELVSAAAVFQEAAERQGDVADVEAFLESASLLGTADDAHKDDDDGRGKITLMTLHACKGLEFEMVFLVGLEEHGFPHSRAIDGDVSALEEERRLAYVGITRARQRLILSWAKQRMVNGTIKTRDPSRFLFEIPRAALDGDIPRRRGESSFQRETLLSQWKRRHNVGAGHADNDDDARHGERVVYDEDGAVDVDITGGQPSRLHRERTRRTQLIDSPIDVTFDGGTTVVLDDDVVQAAPTTATNAATTAPGRRFVLGLPVKDSGAPSLPIGADGNVGAETDGDASFNAGDRVRHKLFGEGSVVGQRGGGRNATVLVRFDAERGPRVIAARFLFAT